MPLHAELDATSTYTVHAIRYAHMAERRRHENFVPADAHDGADADGLLRVAAALAGAHGAGGHRLFAGHRAGCAAANGRGSVARSTLWPRSTCHPTTSTTS